MSQPLLTLPNVRREYDPATRHTAYVRQCDRCPAWRKVRDPRARLNLCGDCSLVLTPAERSRWAA